MEVTTVFLSSTYEDLQPYREAARHVLSQIERVQCIGMETFGARPEAADPFCRNLVAESDLFLGLLGHCYGSCPKDSPRSFTEGEFDAAIEAGREQLVFLLDDNAPAEVVEPPEVRKKQQAFRTRVRDLLMVDMFTDAADLKVKISLAVNRWLRARELKHHGAALLTATRKLGRHFGRAGDICLALAVLLAAGTMVAAVLGGSLGQSGMIAALVLFVAAMVLGCLGFFFWNKEQEARMAPHRYIDKGEFGLDQRKTRKRRSKRDSAKRRRSE